MKLESNHIIKSREEVKTFLARLIYALKDKHTRIIIKYDRNSEGNKNIEHTNRFTIYDLNPDKPPEEFIRNEFSKLTIEEYMYCLEDDLYPDRNNLFVFARLYEEKGYVYIKPRVNLITTSRMSIIVISFHYSTIDINDICFPYKNL
ncbi:hypothetical protein ACAG96_00810 [Candidatus Izemoplasma sp. B36]|uniref:hypothetical protein n=1 Tax=Candidatus Izemoplasma sp. B36 TaxID=3242468 RepID=UPI003558A28A